MKILSLIFYFIVGLIAVFTFKKDDHHHEEIIKEEFYNNENTDPIIQFNNPTAMDKTIFDIDMIPVFHGDPYHIVNNNIPYFSQKEISAKPYEYYGELDELGRCSVTHACLGKETMPKKCRQEIGMVKPTGWHTKKYDCIDGGFLYNRSHLIGHQLSAEDANRQNLITGTRFFNVQGMLPFEHMIADYIDETHNHVMYRVDPIYSNDELIARGVLLEALSVEDHGDGICCNVFVYNAQPDIDIDYHTGMSHLSYEKKFMDECDDLMSVEDAQEYILNTNSMKFHRCSCKYAQGTNHRNKKMFYGSREELINKRYIPCGYCKP